MRKRQEKLGRTSEEWNNEILWNIVYDNISRGKIQLNCEMLHRIL